MSHCGGMRKIGLIKSCLILKNYKILVKCKGTTNGNHKGNKGGNTANISKLKKLPPIYSKLFENCQNNFFYQNNCYGLIKTCFEKFEKFGKIRSGGATQETTYYRTM
jgi:hypothetical protein